MITFTSSPLSLPFCRSPTPSLTQSPTCAKSSPPPLNPPPKRPPPLPRHQTYTAIKSATLPAAKALFNDHLTRHPPTPKLLSIYTKRLCESSQFQTAHETLSAHPLYDTAIARTTIVACACRLHGPDVGLQQLSHMHAAGFRAPHAYTAAIHSLGCSLRARDALRLVREAEDFEVADGGVYDAGIRALGRVGRVKEAFELARCMTNKGFKCSEHTYVGLLYACCHADKAEEGRAFVVFDAAKADGVVNAKVLGAMASFVLKKGVWADDRVEALVNDMNKVVSENHFGYGIDPQRFVQKLQDLSRLRFDAQIL